MAENPQFLSPTNQIFHNNFPKPNSIPQQFLAVDNQITQLGFGHFYRHDQEQQQRRIWAGQQISNSHYEPQGRERIGNGLTNNNAVSNSLSLPSFPVNFSMGQNGDYGKGGGIMGEEEEEEDALLMRGREQFAHCWRNQGDSPIKQQQPSLGRSLFTEVLNRNNKRCMGSEEINEEANKQNQNKRFKFSEEALSVVPEPARKILDNNGEVEAIYRGPTVEQINKTNNEPVQDQLEAINNGVGKEESMADLFNRIVNRVIHHQEILHQRLLQTIERLDEKRNEKEEAWRKEELARTNQLTIVRERDQALASSREATVISYLEKITGQNMIIPGNKHDASSSADTMNVNKRWRKIEVETLIRIRTSLEPKFCDPALKDFLWEEISKLMGSMGYIRSGQRCKEKWANINGYYKKAKENSKVHSAQKLKSCPYFQQLDKFYTSKSYTNGFSSSSSPFSSMIQGRNLIPFGNVEENRELCIVKDDRKLNHIIEANEDDEEEEGSDADLR